MTIEQLTDEDRAWLRNDCRPTGKRALRIIDAHAADRTALVAQLEESEADKVRLYDEARTLVAQLEAAKTHAGRQADARVAAEAQVAELTRERDEAREQARHAELNMQSSARAWQSEVTRLTEAELAAAKADDQLSRTQRDVLQGEVGRLKEALAAAERREKAANLDADHNGERAEAAEARVRELLALLDAQAAVITGLRAAEAQVRELEAELARVNQ